MTDCPVCGLPSEPVDVYGLKGVGTEGQAIIVWFEKRWCPARHYYQVELYEEDA